MSTYLVTALLAYSFRTIVALLLTGSMSSAAEPSNAHSIQNDDESSITENIQEAILVIGGATEGMPYVNISMAWVPSENRWYRLADMPTRRRAMAYSEHGGELYVIGGWTDEPADQADGEGKVALDLLEIYNPMTNTWRRGADMPTKRGKMAHMFPAIDGRIPVAGGERLGERLREAAVYHIAGDRWEVIDEMPATWTFPYVMANPYEANLVHFAAGNTDAQWNPIDWHTVLDMDTYEWHHNARARHPIEITDGDGAVFFQHRWWTFGGWSHQLGSVGDIYAYDFAADGWQQMPHPPFKAWTHQGTSVIEVDGEERIYMMGGRTDPMGGAGSNKRLTDAVFYYDGYKWHEEDTRMPVALWNFVCVTKKVNLANLVPYSE
jgi:N-acetylneuraminic acid mutarotase